jgi:hypothetical protein
MKISQIELHTNSSGFYQVKIKHDTKSVKSGWHKLSPDAYWDAECKLIYKPAYVYGVPRSEYM